MHAFDHRWLRINNTLQLCARQEAGLAEGRTLGIAVLIERIGILAGFGADDATGAHSALLIGSEHVYQPVLFIWSVRSVWLFGSMRRTRKTRLAPDVRTINALRA